jgi:S-layer protein (TIGR01567 family)
MGMDNICRKCTLRKVIGITSLAILLLASAAGAATLTVDDGGGANYTRIQDAIDNASAEDTILVYSGTYYENVHVSKQLVLRGVDNGGGKPVVDAKGNGDAITLSIGKSTLEGFTVVNSGTYDAGIRVYSNDNMIRNNTASNNMRGIYLNLSNNNIVRDNIAITASNWYAGINLKISNNNTLDNNTISNYDNGYGILLESSSNNNLIGNTATNCRGGIDLLLSNYNIVRNNTVIGSSLVSIMSDGNNNIIYNNFFNSTSNWGVGTTSLSTWNISKTAGTNIIGGSYLGGNVWANPSNTDFSQTCTDADSDGICDTSYTIYGSNIDYLPLAYKPAIPDTTAPILTFTAQTPSNLSSIGQKWVFIEINSNELLKNALLEWNVINESMCCFATDRHKRKVSLANGTHKFRVWGSDYFGNWNSTELRVITVSAPPDRTTGGSSGKGQVAFGPMIWNASNFPAFWHDDSISGENLTVQQSDLGSNQRTIHNYNLIYSTMARIIPYRAYTETGLTVEKGLECQYGSGGGCYAKVGWLGKPYVAVQGKANKLAELVLEQNSTESKNLSVGATWNLGEGYSLKLESLDTKALPLQAGITFNKSGTTLDDQVVDDDTRAVYTYVSKSFANESDVPIFITYVDNISSNSIRLKYTWLISDNVTEVHSGAIFGKLKVFSAGTDGIELGNDAAVILTRNATINLLDGLYFVVNDSTSLAYYPMMTNETPTPTIPSLLSIVINNGNVYTNSTSVTLGISAVNAEEMSFSNDNGSWSAWEPFAAAKSWPLTDGDGLKTVYFKARNGAGEAVNDTIILDTTPPSVTNVSIYPTTPVINHTVNITAKVIDANLNDSGIFVSVKHPGGYTNISPRINLSNNIFFHNYDNTSEYGRYDVTIIAGDRAGNINDTEKTWFVTTKSHNQSVSIRGGGNAEIAYGPKMWNRTNFQGLVHEETLNVQHVSGRVIPVSNLWYNTTRQIVRYKVNEANSSLLVTQGLDINGTQVSEGGYYAKIGWQGISYVAFNGKANKLSKLIMEQDASDNKTLRVGETWEIGDGWTLSAQSIDAQAKQVWLVLSKDGVRRKFSMISEGQVYTYIPVLVTYVDNISVNSVRLKYTWLISSVTLNGVSNIPDRNPLLVGETWDIEGGWTLTAPSIDSQAKLVWITLSKDGNRLDDDVVPEGGMYTYDGKNQYGDYVPQFVTYVDSIFGGTISDMVQLRHTSLISNATININEIKEGNVFGKLKAVMTNNSINLTNFDSPLNLSQDSTTNLMDSLYIGVTDNISLEYYPFFHQAVLPVQVNASEITDVTLEILTDRVLDGAIEISKMEDIPPEMNTSFVLTPFGKYISINASESIINNLTWMKLKLYYTKAELDASGLDEASLKISYCNESAVPYRWELLKSGSPQWVYGTGIETADINGYAGYVWANISHLSTFAIVGSVTTTTTTTTTGGGDGGGGGGGGGGGASGENFSNIEVRESYEEAIFKDKVTSYKFKNASNPISFINITGNISAGLINTMVEALRNTSTLVKNPAPGLVHKNVNIWVGTSGFAVPKNIKGAVIRFRMNTSWISDNNLTSSDIKMVRWGGIKWVQLETTEKMKDSNNTYFEATTDTFSAIPVLTPSEFF